MPLSPRQARRLAGQVLDEAGVNMAEAVPRADGEEAAAAGPLPRQVGRCLIRRLIAAGGMGVVYEGEQENPRRTVAVKVMSRQFAARGRAALRRFEYEAQILARLDHPGIARIYDAGTWDDGGGGVPYFVMEYIPNARNIVEFAVARKLGRRQRLELLASVCDAVHHGHQKGIIHRDLKPGNIMVQERSGDEGDPAAPGQACQPKVIDFGVARAADTDVSLTTMHTSAGDIVGTLQYMSPEQCNGDPHAIDVRSDIYALGVILYELLCGRLPYDLSNTPIPRAARIVQEQEPGRPSMISPALKGDVESITLKALEKDPDRRYQSAAELARDVRRHLAGEPIEARTPSPWARLIRFIGRHPVLATGGACLSVVGLTLVGTLTSVWWLNLRPHHMVLTSDGREARLISVAGRILHAWKSPVANGISYAAIVPSQKDGTLALIGYNNRHEGPRRGALCAFNAASNRDTPVWVRRITEDDRFPELVALDVDAGGFGVSWGMIEDIFPELPGSEVVVAYSHAPRSPGAIAIYNTTGRLLYRIWHDGSPGSGYWMEEARLFVVASFNSEVYWPARGHPEASAPHPFVVYALRPVPGPLGETWTTPSPGGDSATLAWYRCLLPPDAYHLIRDFHVGHPPPQYDPRQFFVLTLMLKDEKGAMSLVLDASGNEVPNSRVLNDLWQSERPLPADYFQLGDLPPALPTPAGE